MSLPTLVKRYDRVKLLLQGGGALGSYQAGIYEGIHKAGIRLDHISGISIGALNTAIIAGNPYEKRVKALRDFWNLITDRNYTSKNTNIYKNILDSMHVLGKIEPLSHAMPYVFENQLLKQQLRVYESGLEAFQTMIEGQRGFFKPRYYLPFDTTPNHLSYYSTDKLRETLADFVDLDLINDPEHMVVSVGAVNVRTGNYTFFHNEHTELSYDHFIASGSLPPSFPAVEIDGEYYWDGGIVSNTPLNDVLFTQDEAKDQLIFQVDLWDAKGALPENLLEIDERLKDIQYSSKTRMVTEMMRQKHTYTHLIKELLKLIPKDAQSAACIKDAKALTDVGVKNVIHLIYRKKAYERGHKDYEFSRSTMQEHWASGLKDIENTFKHEEWFEFPADGEIFEQHDIHQKRKRRYSQGAAEE